MVFDLVRTVATENTPRVEAYSRSSRAAFINGQVNVCQLHSTQIFDPCDTSWELSPHTF